MQTFGRSVKKPKPILAKNQEKPTDLADIQKGDQEQTKAPQADMKVPQDLTNFQQELSTKWSDCWDFRIRSLVSPDIRSRIVICWLKVMIDRTLLMDGILEPVQQLLTDNQTPLTSIHVESILSVPWTETITTMREVHQALASGQAIIFVDGCQDVIAADVGQVRGRNVDISQGEPAIQGPQAAFVEQLDVNLGQVRRILHDARLKIRSYSLGEISHSNVVLLYMDGVSKDSLIQEWETRIERLKLDAVIDSNKLRELTTDGKWSLFPLIESTERPDKVVNALLEGRLAVGLDGDPEFLLMPTIFTGLLTSSEDYYGSFAISLPLRLLRHLMFWMSLTMPSIYISLLTYNQDLIPTPLLINLEAQHEGIPFPTFFEACLMQFSFEALREAGVRLPRAVGQSVSIVGALVIGEAAVSAGVVSPGMVIVVAATGVASFTIPDYTLVNTVRVLQWGFFITAGLMGLYGMVLFGIVIVLHLTSLRSLGIPYVAPVAPTEPQSLKDVIFRAPSWLMKTRPKIFEPQNATRVQQDEAQPSKYKRKQTQ